jgi:arsenate reductase
VHRFAEGRHISMEKIGQSAGRVYSRRPTFPIRSRPGPVPPPAMLIHIYQYPKCSTCRKALSWLDGHGVKYQARDLVADPIPLAKLEELHRRSKLPVARFFNTSGESYRAGHFKDRLPKMSDQEALGALAQDGKLVKRPIVDAGKVVLVGFDAESFAEHFA